ncbi:MAG: Hpt domain-containing protein, partial [Steroidobacteraceae bacterium]
PWYMLDNAESCLKALADEPPLPAPAVDVDEPDAFARTLKIDGSAAAQAAADMARTGAVDSPERHVATHPVVEAPPSGEPDPEFLELFIEEAREEVTSIQINFPAWEQNPHDNDALMTMRRSFHTLKGSGRMVGAKLIGEFSWAIETLLNRVINKTLSRSPAIVGVIREGVAVLPDLVEQLEVGRAPMADVPSIMERAHAIAEGREAESQPAAGEPTMVDAPAAPPPAARPTPLAAAAPPARSAAPARAVDAEAARGMDTQLHEIYSKETAGHIAVIREYLRRCASLTPPYEVPEAVYRACHTLSGSSKMAEARQGIKVAEPLNHYMRKVFDSGRGLSAEGLKVLEDSVGAIEDVVQHINESTGYFLGQQALIERIHELDRRFDEEPISETSLEPSIIAPAPPMPPPAAAAQEPDAIEDEDEGESFDAEVAAIFSEEATELLEAADAALSAWNQDRNNQQHVAELQRPLHTLKGGARMAGITAMGDLSHEVETLVMQINAGAVAADDRSYDVVQASLDELSQMRDAVSSGRRVAPARALMARIRSLSQAAAAPAPAAVVPMPVAAPAPKPAPVPVAKAPPREPAPARREVSPPAPPP